MTPLKPVKNKKALKIKNTFFPFFSGNKCDVMPLVLWN